jgi:hypothetical protein
MQIKGEEGMIHLTDKFFFTVDALNITLKEEILSTNKLTEEKYINYKDIGYFRTMEHMFEKLSRLLTVRQVDKIKTLSGYVTAVNETNAILKEIKERMG